MADLIKTDETKQKAIKVELPDGTSGEIPIEDAEARVNIAKGYAFEPEELLFDGGIIDARDRSQNLNFDTMYKEGMEIKPEKEVNIVEPKVKKRPEPKAGPTSKIKKSKNHTKESPYKGVKHYFKEKVKDVAKKTGEFALDVTTGGKYSAVKEIIKKHKKKKKKDKSILI
jgi:hypothetical protein